MEHHHIIIGLSAIVLLLSFMLVQGGGKKKEFFVMTDSQIKSKLADKKCSAAVNKFCSDTSTRQLDAVDYVDVMNSCGRDFPPYAVCPQTLIAPSDFLLGGTNK
jgi:hypothetical protein